MLFPSLDFPYWALILRLKADGGIRQRGWLRKRAVVPGFSLVWALEGMIQWAVALGFSTPRDALGLLAEVFGARDWATQTATELFCDLVRRPVDPESAIQRILEEEGLAVHPLQADVLHSLEELTVPAFAGRVRLAFGRGLLLGLAEPELSRAALESTLREIRKGAREAAQYGVAQVDPSRFTVDSTVESAKRAVAAYVENKGSELVIPDAMKSGLPEPIRLRTVMPVGASEA